MSSSQYDPWDYGNNAPVAAPVAPAPTFAPQPSQRLTANPQLSQTPLGAYTDSQYEAAVAQLRAQVSKQYADILQQLGYQNDQGQFIPGTVEAAAQKQSADLNRSMGLARDQVTQGAQREGTLFSGLRGVNQGQAEHPFASALADLATQTPLTLQKLHEQGAGLVSDFTLQNNVLLADAAARQAAKFAQTQGLGPSSAVGADTTPDYYPPLSPVEGQPGTTPGGVASGSFYGVTSPANPTQYSSGSIPSPYKGAPVPPKPKTAAQISLDQEQALTKARAITLKKR